MTKGSALAILLATTGCATIPNQLNTRWADSNKEYAFVGNDRSEIESIGYVAELVAKLYTGDAQVKGGWIVSSSPKNYQKFKVALDRVYHDADINNDHKITSEEIKMLKRKIIAEKRNASSASGKDDC